MKRALDLYCGAGGASMGLHRAGYQVTGVDLRSQPHYPFPFRQASVFDLSPAFLQEFDLLWSSPPCQRYSCLTPPAYRANHPDLIAPTRTLLRATGRPYIIENVAGARHLLITPLMLCGSMFGKAYWRHRYFEINGEAYALRGLYCRHNYTPVLISGQSTRRIDGKRQSKSPIAVKAATMEIDWMTGAEITEAIPPIYAEFLARALS